VIGAYSGVDPTAPMDVQGGQVQTTIYDGPITAPSVTPTLTGTRLVGFFGSTAVRAIAPAPAMTEIRDSQVASGDGAASSLQDEALTAPGPTGTRVAVQSVGNMGIGPLVPLRPAVSTSDPVVTLTWTPTVSSFASGYTLRRWNGAVAEDQRALTPRSTATFTDDPLVSGTTYDFELQSVHEGWTSSSRRVTITPTCP